MSIPTTLHAPGIKTPLHWSDFKVIAFDMDSTLINIECIDELAKEAGVGEQVVRITEATMRGEIKDFKESLRARVQLLKGLPLESLERVYTNKLRLNPGVKTWVETCQTHGLKTILVSGGFTYFAHRVSELLRIDFSRSNELEVEGGVLTGKLTAQSWGEICDGEEKRRMLQQTCSELGLSLASAIAVGDGANDLPMMKACQDAGGLSVAYHAKPAVKAQAMVSVESGGMDELLSLFQS
jgi:phosphoserine phosphatase